MLALMWHQTNRPGKKRGKCWQRWPNARTILSQCKFALNLHPDAGFNANEPQFQLNRNADAVDSKPDIALALGMR